MVKIIRPTLVTKANREAVLGFLVIAFVLLSLLCSAIIAILTVKVTNITVENNFRYVVEADGKIFNFEPDDILRVDRTPARQGITGKQIEILKIYTTNGFIYAVPRDEFYAAALKIVNAVDTTGAQTYVQEGVSWDDVQQRAYAIGTTPAVRPFLFALRGMQNLCFLATGLSLLALIFPLRPAKEQDSSRVVTRMEQPA